MEERIPFELFKSNMCHELKRRGDIPFLIHFLKNDRVSSYYNRKWYPECFYTLAMVDYISRINNVELCTRYEYLRSMKLPEIVFPSGILAICVVEKSERMKEQALKECIPEFLRHNIVEADIRNVV